MFGESHDGNILGWAAVEVIEDHRRDCLVRRFDKGFTIDDSNLIQLQLDLNCYCALKITKTTS